jgi:hypothetical protein
MTPTLRTRWTRKEFVPVLTIVTLICAVAFLSDSLARPKPVPSAELGPEWQCTTSLFMTSCTRIPQSEAVVDIPLKKAVCSRRG